MGRYLIQTPVATATFDLGPVHFHNGRVELDEVPHWLRNYAESAGYTITDQGAQPAEVEVDDDDNDPTTRPPVNAKVDVWRAHALAIGATEDQVAGATKEQLKELADQLAKEGDQQ